MHRTPGCTRPHPDSRAVRALPRRALLLRGLAVAIALSGACLAAGPAVAAGWPDKPVRVIVPFTAGGATDSIARAVSQRLGAIWKQSVVVENKPGAGGLVGAESVARAEPDGYTLLLASGSMFTVNPFIYSSLPYSLKDFALISNVATGPMVVAVNPKLPVHDLQGLVAYVKQRPGKVNFGSAGVGTQTHMAAEQLADVAGLNAIHVPYKGESAAYADLMAGHIDFVVGNIAALAPLVSSGRVRGVAVTGAARSAMLPDVPTAAEAGLPKLQSQGWFALMAPASTPKDVLATIQRGVGEALANADTRKALEAQGSSATPSSPQQLAQTISAESVMWQAVVSRRNLKAN
ncbi:Bug family tripartite tricarboxylate transporter substrate binding protein [Bordetella genomosp. 13]|uniref:Bug family tripartite tricarboxylate transporter substrate binding protein n=1 Tax=Bordetella genomosp. 13 TaxID=463040 RepID=UPI0011AA0646|nr:tripartite tricarboxylate transporter substrate binding protein [Bordetella genomosp. 13]